MISFSQLIKWEETIVFPMSPRKASWHLSPQLWLIYVSIFDWHRDPSLELGFKPRQFIQWRMGRETKGSVYKRRGFLCRWARQGLPPVSRWEPEAFSGSQNKMMTHRGLFFPSTFIPSVYKGLATDFFLCFSQTEDNAMPLDCAY